MTLLKALLDILASVLGIARNRSDAAKSPEMKANAKAKTDGEIKADAAATLKRRNLDEIRNKLGCIALTLCLLSLTIGPGCATTITADRVAPTAASYDPTDTASPTSGILSIDDTGATLTADARARYNALLATYAAAFRPRLPADYGLTPLDTTPITYRLNNAGLQRWLIMAEWSRMGRTPSD